MKNLSLLLNAVLIIAVAFLYVKVYTKKEDVAIAVPKQAKEASIVFVNSDSLLEHYNFYQELKKTIEHKRDSADAVLKNKGNAFQEEVKDYQSKGAGMSEQDRAQTEEMLMKKEKNLRAENDEAVDHLQKEEEKLNDQLHDHLVGYLKKYNKTKNYEFIFGYQRGSGILLAHDSLDITRQVIEGINKEK